MARIVRLGPESWARLRAVRLTALSDEPDAYGSTLDEERIRTEEDWRRSLDPGPWWVADDGGVDVGLVAGGRHRETGAFWVFSMWVAASHRGAGVAVQLCDEVVGWARAAGASTLGLDVTDRVPRARRFYERMGFVATGTVATLARDPSIVLTEMMLDL